MPMVLNCPSCGAGINAPPGAEPYVHTCRFCNARVPIEPLVPRPPPGIPTTVQSGTAAREAKVARETKAASERPKVAVAKAAARGMGCFFSLLGALPVVIAVGAVAGPWLLSTYSARFGNFPIDVPLNGSIEIADRDFTGSDTLVNVGMNGKVTIRRCHLKAPLLVKADVNGEVTIIDSTLDGQRGVIEGSTNLVVHIQNSAITSAEEIVDAPQNAKIDVSKDSKLHSDAVAFPLESNAEIAIDHSAIEGKLGAIDFRNNGHVKLTDATTVRSDGPAIELAQNGHLTITSSRVESKTEAVRVGNNVEGTLRGAVLVGPKFALEVGDYGRLTLTQTTLTGPKKVGASRIEER